MESCTAWMERVGVDWPGIRKVTVTIRGSEPTLRPLVASQHKWKHAQSNCNNTLVLRVKVR